MVKDLWPIKYRPSKIADYIFQDESQKNIFEGFIREKSIPQLLFSGHRGTGKTTLARILKNELEIDDCDFMKLNASDDNSVETIRSKIKNFISTIAMGSFKVILLDEADFLTLNAQAILRGFLEDEDIVANARFILTCNYPKKIIPEIRSRCQEFYFSTLSKDSILEQVANVLTAEKVKVPNLDLLDEYIDAGYPDMRKILNLLQQNTTDGKLQSPTNVETSIEYKLKILELLEQNDWQGGRNVVCENVDGDEWVEVYKFLYDYIHEVGKFKDQKKWKAAIVIIAEHLFKHQAVADPEINFSACIIRLTEI